MPRRLALLMTILALATSACASVYPGSPRSDWRLIGQREVTDRIDHDRISVTTRQGDFRRLKVAVERASVDFHQIVIHYGNGDRQVIRMRTTVRAGGESRVLDLPGGDRVIRSIEFWYDANTLRGRSAVVRVLGRG